MSDKPTPTDMKSDIELLLLPHQAKFFDAVYWLMNGPKSSGKSYLMACVMIKTALDFPWQKVKISDHSDLGNTSKGRSNKNMINLLQHIISEKLDMEDKFKISTSDNTLIYDPK